ncbi:uncharacterized protein LOC114726004 [Neltuma alba]|uniref:uncharacterized protein LOC114726004 n=1 Tax=Neltuma alba TaxID=207710 RepID=UPI0010A4BF02|nr:uncharacterized protein LOC114726004 [Prosopis alba]
MIIVWNVRGAAGNAFGHAMKDMKKRLKPSLVVLVETRCSGINAQKAIKRMGFKYQEIVEANGMSGGIWILWDDENIKLKALEKHHQFLHCEVNGLRGSKWLFTAIYASPRAAERQLLWESLKSMSRNINGPWLLAGDFNDIKTPEEQRGGIKVNERKCNKFCSNMNDCNLIDMGTEGPKYTWKGPIVHLGISICT